ncbi:MAG: hypothetical protein ACRDV3_08390 [Acidothermaceae bacterium]
MLGLARVVCDLRSDCTFPGDPGKTIKRRTRAACPVVSPATKDPVWLPIVTACGWVVISRDSHISSRPGEIDAVKQHGARLVVLSGKEARGPWEQLEILMAQWRRIEVQVSKPGPWIYSATRTHLDPVQTLIHKLGLTN